MKITVGHTPDADDAFMFYGMLTGKVDSGGLEIEHTVEDIETLNKAGVEEGGLDITAVSVHACAHMPGYTILRSGGSFGLGYGPIVVARQGKEISDVCVSPTHLPIRDTFDPDNPPVVNPLIDPIIAVPGRLTSAFLLLRLMIGEYRYEEMKFSDIPDAVSSGRLDAGLVIHETQLTYASEGTQKISDVGEWWAKETGGLPVPLGVNVARDSLGDEAITKFDAHLRDSIQYGLDHFDDAMDYAMKYSRSKPRDLLERFVKMYVNPSTVEMGSAGEESIRRFLQMGRQKGWVPAHEPRIAQRAANG